MNLRATMPAVLILSVCALPAIAQETPKPVQATSPAAKPAKRVCRRDSEIGTRIARSTCHTAAEWAEIDEATRRDALLLLDRTSDQGSQTGAGVASGSMGR